MRTVLRPVPAARVLAAVSMALIAASCGGSESTTIAAADASLAVEPAPTEVPTTAPLTAPTGPTADESLTQPTTIPDAATAVPDTEPEEPAPTPTGQALEQEPEAPAESPTADPTPLPAATGPTPLPATTVPQPTATATPAPAPITAVIGLPDVTVVNLLTGQEASLSSYSPSGPTLLWFWAPH